MDRIKRRRRYPKILKERKRHKEEEAKLMIWMVLGTVVLLPLLGTIWAYNNGKFIHMSIWSFGMNTIEVYTTLALLGIIFIGIISVFDSIWKPLIVYCKSLYAKVANKLLNNIGIVKAAISAISLIAIPYLFTRREGCKNRHEICDKWATLGVCDKSLAELGLDDSSENLEYMQTNCLSSCRPKLCHTFDVFFWLSICGIALMIPTAVRFVVRGVSRLKEEGVSLLSIHMVCIRVLEAIKEIYQTTTIQDTIYVSSSQSKNINGKQSRKEKKGIYYKSGVEDMQLELSDTGSYVVVHLKGSRRSVWKAIEMIQEAVGIEHVSVDQPCNTNPVIASATFKPNQDDDVPVENSALIQEEPSTPESPVPCESDKAAPVEKEAVSTEQSKSVKDDNQLAQKVPSEIGIDSSQGMTRETITKASTSILNDGSKISNAAALNTIDVNEYDPLLMFLRSQASCIKGSVDEFYSWLVKSEDIDSMIALKEAVNEDEYLSTKLKKGNGSSGLKGFKVPPFKRAVLEYFNDESDIKPAKEESNKIPAAGLDEPPEELVCPISLNLMVHDPVVAADGITYERESIEDWFQKSKAKMGEAQEKLNQNTQKEADQRVVNNGICSPVHGIKLKNLTLVSNISMRNMARAYEEKRKSPT